MTRLVVYVWCLYSGVWQHERWTPKRQVLQWDLTTICSNYFNHSKFNNLPNWKGLHDHWLSRNIMGSLTLSTTMIWNLRIPTMGHTMQGAYSGRILRFAPWERLCERQCTRLWPNTNLFELGPHQHYQDQGDLLNYETHKFVVNSSQVDA